MHLQIKEQINNPSLKHIPAKQYYVYRHYCIDSSGKEETFYVGKGQGFRGMSESSRNELWTRKVNELNGSYFIDIVKYFDNEKDALAFEKDLIAYYILFEFGCKCNKQSTDIKDSRLNKGIHKKLFDNSMNNKDSLLDVLHLYFSIEPSNVDNTNRLYDTMINLRDKLVDINSSFSISLNPENSIHPATDLRFYCYKSIEPVMRYIESMLDKHSPLESVFDYFRHAFIEYSNTDIDDIVLRLNKMLISSKSKYEIFNSSEEADNYHISYNGYYYLHSDDLSFDDSLNHLDDELADELNNELEEEPYFSIKEENDNEIIVDRDSLHEDNVKNVC